MSSSSNISTGWYHSALRICVVLFALALVFESGILSPATRNIAHLAGQQFATAIQATVDTSYSEDAMLIAETNNSQLIETSIPATQPIDRSTFLLSVMVFILLLLIVLNYILDHLRNQVHKHLESQQV